MQREVDAWGSLRHQHISPLIAYCTDTMPSVVMPWYENRDFWAYTEKRGDLKTKLKLVSTRVVAVTEFTD